MKQKWPRYHKGNDEIELDDRVHMEGNERWHDIPASVESIRFDRYGSLVHIVFEGYENVGADLPEGIGLEKLHPLSELFGVLRKPKTDDCLEAAVKRLHAVMLTDNPCAYFGTAVEGDCDNCPALPCCSEMRGEEGIWRAIALDIAEKVQAMKEEA